MWRISSIFKIQIPQSDLAMKKKKKINLHKGESNWIFFSFFLESFSIAVFWNSFKRDACFRPPPPQRSSFRLDFKRRKGGGMSRIRSIFTHSSHPEDQAINRIFNPNLHSQDPQPSLSLCKATEATNRRAFKNKERFIHLISVLRAQRIRRLRVGSRRGGMGDKLCFLAIRFLRFSRDRIFAEMMAIL